jgi:LysR family hydrogen peroxide-inducible transcriptional activator
MERSTRQVFFTPLGEAVVAEAREVLETVERIRELAKQSDDPMQGDFHIGLIPTVGPFLLPLIMPAIGKVYPQARLYLYEQQTSTLIDRLLKGELDAAILAKLEWDYPVVETSLYREQMRLAVASSDPLGGLDTVPSRSVMEGRTVLMLEDGHCLRDQALGVCFAAGAREDNRFQATSMDTLLQMVGAGVGMTLIPELACRGSLSSVAFLKFDEAPPSREIVMLTRRNCAREQALQGFAELIGATASDAL